MNIRHYGKRILGKFAVLVLATIALSACGSSSDQLFYVALGDSLSVGVQQDPNTGQSVPTDQGYADQLFAQLQPQFPNLELMKLGCPGETTTSMVNGGVCDTYSSGSQLNDALQFLVDNQDQILLVTIDIGANDALQSGCLDIMDPTEQQACIMEAFTALGSNLTLITNKLFAAADGKFPVIGMNYYNPFLNAWFLGPPQGPALVEATTTLVVGLNTQVLAPVYGLSSDPVADVATAFNTTDATLVPFPLPPPFDMVPLNVATACQLTYLCPAPTSGLEPNIHPNAAGYKVISDVFLAVFNSL